MLMLLMFIIGKAFKGKDFRLSGKFFAALSSLGLQYCIEGAKLIRRAV